ncbi:MAG: hypothetical protein QNJ70_20170 [Xenococcaceae cyanobacterium MO_207.B15]|nr:hypothetical protein [Xenococcaceae cyanobacterium MO_207.B15]
MYSIQTSRINNYKPIFCYPLSSRSAKTLLKLGEKASHLSLRDFDDDKWIDEDVAYFTLQRVIKLEVNDCILACYYRLLQELTEITKIAKINRQKLNTN